MRRFLGEAQHLARLRHPNIVSIHEVGDANGEPYFTMDFIDGQPLSAEIRRGPMSPTQALAILKQVAQAVQHAHRQGIIHRDLKPSNVLIDRDGTPFVTDFGLARDIRQSSDLTQSGQLLGTPQYMAPEQARGQTSLIGEATDIHALGLLLFELLTGRAAFASSSPADVLVRLLNEDPPPLRSLDRRIPRDLETICQQMLQKSPAARYANVSALLEDIRRFEAGEPLVARRTSVAKRTARWMQRHWKIAATIVVTAVLAVVIAAPLFDKSFDELVAWGDEEMATGNPNVAAQVYLRSLRSASDDEKPLVVDRIVQTCRSLDDPKAAVDLAMQVIELAPDESFGPHNYLVAKALVAREGADENLGVINVWHSKPESMLNLVKSRLELALEGTLSDDQKMEAEQILTNVNLAISEGAYPVRYHPEYLYKLPQGNVDELQRMVRNETSAVWNRAKAGIALGKLHENSGRINDATAAYQQAYDRIRSVYPMYAGVKAAIGSKSRVDSPDAKECGLVHDLVDTLHRLAPNAVPLPGGRVEFDVVGVAMPPSVHIELSLELCDPKIDNPDGGLPHNLPRLLPLRQDAPVSATVLDGKYRLRISDRRTGWDESAADHARLLQVDIEDWPEEIEVRGEVVKLPPVRLRLAKAVKLQTPTSGATVKLSDTELQWLAVPNADFYRVHLEFRKETPHPTAVMFLAVDVDAPRLRLMDLSEEDKIQVRGNLTSGRTGAWRVDAYDASGRQIGTTLKENRFLVAEPLSQS